MQDDLEMAFPPGFTYGSEDDFVQRLIIPLVQRLGFSLIADYHRTHGEFGKDLVFAEIDRFSHIRYSGLQAKYEPSIGLAAVETLIQDARQAFANPFKHPHTHTEERIQTFYVVNGGSISDDARTHFFASVGVPTAACCRMLDGKSLLSLDRWATLSRTDAIVATVVGLLAEVAYNASVGKKITEFLSASTTEQIGPLPPDRFRVDASSAYLTRPVLPSRTLSKNVMQYWHCALAVNRFVDAMHIASNTNRRTLLGLTQTAFTSVESTAPLIEVELREFHNSIAPLAAM